MNETIKIQLNHRTIREFKNQPLPKEDLEKLHDVINMTASSNGMQNYSVIRVTDQNIKNELAEIGLQEYMRRAPELLIFIVDLYRNYKIAQEMGKENKIMIGFDKFMQGFTDACLAAQNYVVAAESLGYGTNYYGNIHNDTKKVIDLLKLPKYTFPVVGVGIGIPNQKPQLKPRMPFELKMFDNGYKKFDSYLEAIKDYDQVMQTYYDLRDANKRVDSFSKQIVKKQASLIANREDVYKAFLDQGFVINKN
ncbi:MAG: NADPH-dependent oxidoreductase [Peptoniphilaceae bacterium]|nr:NADPH-dependent oxidoreductase [Peptoniphilaceae bacterium]MDY6018475.1 NADPH-dependent oxidoreductase [Anaerococcus sp.]